LKEGAYLMSYSFIGYQKATRKIEVKAGEEKVVNLKLMSESTVLDEVVVSASKHEQKRSDITVSMEVIKPGQIMNSNTTTVETVLQKVPGVMIVDKQASIRGGSGYSYGAGSRVLLLVDGLPMLTGASGDAIWDFVAIESIEKIEIIKGAASALFGSSALNGVINIRTLQPGKKPLTQISLSSGFYGDPAREEVKWWGDTVKLFHDIKVFHSQKIGKLDLTIGTNISKDAGFRQNENNQKGRISVNTRYNPAAIKGLCFGINASAMKKEGELFLLWRDGDTGVYMASPSFQQSFDNIRINIDPYITYFVNGKSKHSIRTRYYRIENTNTTLQNNTDVLFYGDYKFQRFFRKQMVFTSGLNASKVKAISELYGDSLHNGNNMALYAQLDKKFDSLTISLGARWERYLLDSDVPNSKPVFRAGLNYKLWKATFLRASFGQGFRYPSIAEKYTLTQVGSLKIFPNDNLKAENGWSAELGVMQGFKLKKWTGYIDLAAFVSQYENMIEFSFGQHYPANLINPTWNDFIDYTGFRAYNISNARISGLDISFSVKGMLKNIPITLGGGYTYTNPIDLDFDLNKGGYSNDTINILKYRFYHSAKLDLEMNIRNFSFGFNLDYHSFMINIDKAFEDSIRTPPNPTYPNGFPVGIILPGAKEYRENQHTGDLVFDTRVYYAISEKQRISFIVKNLLNREYMIRPGDIQAPRNYAMQYSLKF
ncbi:TonB-dependent receptor domain-containing protein, partial [Bacteroidota bacterium]